MLELLKTGAIHEDAWTYRKRVNRIKKMIADYKNRFEKIAVVTHYYTIEYISAYDYEPCGMPKYYIDIKNCQPYYACLDNLLCCGKDE